MKNLILITIAIFTLQTVTAQRPEWTKKGDEKSDFAMFMKDFSPEQMATLQTKRMTLLLDLTAEQISKIYTINLSESKNRKSKMAEMKSKMKQGKPNTDEFYKMMIGRLDNRIGYKKQLSIILNKEQLEKWATLASEHFGESNHFMGGKPNFARGNN
jgi:phosphodiesterase/alkaline phosphatase D-like protein